MNVEYFREIRQVHLGEGFVAQDSGIGAEQIDAAPLFGRAVHHRLDLFEVRDVGAVGHRHAAGFTDFLDHRFRRGQRPAGAVAGAAGIIDHDFRAAGRPPPPPPFRIPSTPVSGGVGAPPVPSRAPPKSLTTTFAPRLANPSACARPRPLPAPVTMATRPSNLIVMRKFLDVGSWRAKA